MIGEKEPGGISAAGLEVSGLTKHYGAHAAIQQIGFRLERGALLTLLGPSGCGKTTLLRAIGGFVAADAGRILVEGQDIGALPPERRPTATVFQGYALFPHMSVAANVAYGLKMQRIPRAEIAGRVRDALAAVQLSAMAERMPSQLSGGQQQRVALARCLVVRPRILLLDEPFSALDRNLREEMQVELRKLQQRLGITTVVVTHDQQEAFILSDWVAVMNAGRLHQFDRPAGVYDAPATRFVASFTGMTNLLEGQAEGQEFVVPGIGRFPLPAAAPPGSLLGLRPGALRLVEPGDPAACAVGEVGFVAMTGAEALCEIACPGGALQVAVPRRPGAPVTGARVGVALAEPSQAVVLAA
ncbi:ABC transporter ATP-binding protein [Rhodovarius lipocyclicus]|uniref:ABC transporter ATP-binding protein n=1 Tax=Rhodovarius lipocyclicus TaxID=268410 RepID=UPI001358C154|nr:ABC transporter ATP-binding protein [Rhodovarius lipocyclicus]